MSDFQKIKLPSIPLINLSHNFIPYLLLLSAGLQPQTLGYSQYPPRTRNAQTKPRQLPSHLPTSTPRVPDVPLVVPTHTIPLLPNNSLPRDEVRATSQQRMKQHQNAPNTTPFTKVATQRSVSWSSNPCSSLDSTASDDGDVENVSGANKPQLQRQDTGYASHGEELGVPENQNIPAALYKPLDLSQKHTTDLLKKLALLIPNWQMLAHQLGLDAQQIEALDTNYVMWQEQCFQMLNAWIEKDGNASCAKLVEELRNMHRPELESLIHQHMEQLSKPTTGITTQTDYANQWVIDIETIDDCIEDIHISVKAVLQHKYKTATIRVSYNK